MPEKRAAFIASNSSSPMSGLARRILGTRFASPLISGGTLVIEQYYDQHYWAHEKPRNPRYKERHGRGRISGRPARPLTIPPGHLARATTGSRHAIVF